MSGPSAVRHTASSPRDLLRSLSDSSYAALVAHSTRLLARYPSLLGSYDAADIVHEAYYHGYMCVNSFNGSTEAELCAWLQGIARNKIRNHAREHHVWRRERMDASILHGIAAPTDRVHSEVEDNHPSCIYDLLSRMLNSEEIALIHSVYLDHQPYAAIANTSQISSQALRKKVSRIIRRLQISLLV